MTERRLALIELPQQVRAYRPIRVMPAEDGNGVGFTGVNYYSLHFWSREVATDEPPEWVLIRTINLSSLTMSGSSIGELLPWSSVAALPEDGDEVFVQSEGAIFVINIRSLQLRKVLQENAIGLPIYPYASFYARGCDIASIDERDDE